LLLGVACKDLKTGRQHSEFTAFNEETDVPLSYVVELRRQGREWKTWRFDDSGDYWAARFLEDLETRQERAAELRREPGIAQALLVNLNNKAVVLRSVNPEKLEDALRMNDLAREVADFLDSHEERAWCALHRGHLLGRTDHAGAIRL